MPPSPRRLTTRYRSAITASGVSVPAAGAEGCGAGVGFGLGIATVEVYLLSSFGVGGAEVEFARTNLTLDATNHRPMQRVRKPARIGFDGPHAITRSSRGAMHNPRIPDSRAVEPWESP